MRAIVTVIGKDQIGIIARVCTFLAEKEINITDISQNIVGGYFNMMTLVETTKDDMPIEQLAEELAGFGRSIGLEIRIQREDIFVSMHRV